MNKNHWSQYWKHGSLTSLPQDFTENYDGEIYNHWFKFVKEIPENSVVVDLCTGNGAVALLIVEIAEHLSKKVKVVAVDAAIIDSKAVILKYPEKEKLINRIEFIDSCPVEKLADTIHFQVDYFISQYGIEYCDMGEVARVLNKRSSDKAQIDIICHSPNTDILKYMEQEAKEYQFMQELGLYDAFIQLHKGDITPITFRTTIARIRKKMPNTSSQLLINWSQLLSQISIMPLKKVIRNQRLLFEFYADHMHARDRARDLIEVSKKIFDPTWYHDLLNNNFKLIEEGTIWYQAKHNAGHFYKFARK